MDDKQEEKKETNLISLSEANDITRFFYDAVKDAQKSTKIELSENVEFYLINLLTNFIRIGDHTAFDDCLVNILKKAVESSHNEKIVLYKKLADNALYFSGFYQEYFTNKSFDIKYYISMGRAAYYELSGLMNKQNTYQNTMSGIYEEMSDSFLKSVEILLCISEKTQHTKASRSILSIYEAWINTESHKLETDLLKRGVIPLPQLLRKMQ